MEQPAKTRNGHPWQCRNVALPACMILAIAGTWAGSAQYSRVAQDSGDLHAVSLIIWIYTLFNMFMFLPWHAFVKCQVQPEGLAVDVNGPMVPRLWEQPWRRQLRIVALQYVMWLTTYYCYTQALAIIPVSLATSLFAASPSFVYLLSLCLLKERPGLWPALAALTSAGGITLISQPWTAAGGASALGSVLAVCGGASVALYNVSLRKHLGKALPAETAYYMGCLGALNIAVGWVIPLTLAGLGAEPRVAARAIPWAPLLASGALGLVSNILTNVGVAVTHPLVVAMGVVVGIPVNLLIDVAWLGEHLDTLQIAGVITMMAAFCLMLAKDALPSCTLCPCGVQPPGLRCALHCCTSKMTRHAVEVTAAVSTPNATTKSKTH